MDGEILDHNRAFAKILGFDASAKLIGTQTPGFWVNQNDRAFYLEALQKKGEIRNYLIIARKINGEKIYLEANSRLIYNKQNKPLQIEGTLVDVTEKKVAEEKLETVLQELEVRNQMNQVFLTIPDEQMYAKVLFIILKAMKSNFGVFGYLNERGDLIVQLIKNLEPDKLFVFPREYWNEGPWPVVIHEKRMVLQNETSTNPPLGHMQITRQISMPIIYKERVLGLLQVANKETDYTSKDVGLLETLVKIIAPVFDAKVRREQEENARQRAEENLLTVNEKLKRSNEELEQFAYVASHDLQEPLRMVSSYVQLLARRYKGKLDSDADDFINYAVDGSERMKNLINDLLTVSRVTTQGQPFIRTNLTEVLNMILKNLTLKIQDNNAIIRSDPLPIINADATQIGQVFQNLIGNAIKFHGDQRPEIHVGVKELKDLWQFFIQDNGIGIEPQNFDKLFRIFQRLNPNEKYPGTGIGLAVCKRIVERHGGQIWVDSELGKGSTFFFSIPKIEGENYHN